MINVDWWQVGPAIASAIATGLAAFAAFQSVIISRESKKLTLDMALASHHSSAADSLSRQISRIAELMKGFADSANTSLTRWAREIGQLDNPSNVGEDPRPLRHVIYDAVCMLADYSDKHNHHPGYKHVSAFSIVRDGGPRLNDKEFVALLAKADYCKSSFDTVFGPPDVSKKISESNAFRWSFDQLTRRVNKEKLSDNWQSAWDENGVLSIFTNKLISIKPALEDIKETLLNEQRRLSLTTFPLDKNKDLKDRMNEAVAIIDSLVSDCDLSILDGYRDCGFEPDAAELIIYSMYVLEVASRVNDRVYSLSSEI